MTISKHAAQFPLGPRGKKREQDRETRRDRGNMRLMDRDQRAMVWVGMRGELRFGRLQTRSAGLPRRRVNEGKSSHEIGVSPR
jgi:hypothetical protein